MFDPHLLMQRALELAREAGVKGEVPIGAVLCDADGKVVAESFNDVEGVFNPTGHAELLAIKKACAALETTKLNDYTLVVTLEPCAMCAQAISWAQVGKVYFGAYDIKSGGTVNGARIFQHCHFKPEIYGGICEEECRDIIQTFFQNKRGLDT